MVAITFARALFGFLLEVYTKFIEHRGALLAGGIAFFIFFSLFPILLFTGVILAYVLEDQAVRAQLMNYVFDNFPVFADLTRGTIEELITKRSSAGVIALIGILWAGTNLFGGLAIGLNAVYEVAETRNLLLQRLIAIVVYLMIAGLIILSFGATAIASVFRDEVLRMLFPDQVIAATWTIFSLALGAVSTILLFLVVYKMVPNVKVGLSSILPGTIVAGLGWELAKYGFAVYLSTFARQGYGLIYGSFATIVLLMFWLYISAVLLLLGAEINVAFRRRASGGVKSFEPRKGSK